MNKRISAISSILVLIYLLMFNVFSYPQVSDQDDIEKGIWLYRHENYDEALRVLERTRKDNPKSSLAAYYLGITYKKLQDYEASRPHLEAACSLTPRIKGAVIELIDLLYRLDALEEAKKWIAVAEKEGIRPAQAAFFKGLTLLKEGKDVEKAIDKLETAKELDGSLTLAVDYNIGVAYMKLKRLKEAKDIFKEITIRDPATDIASFANEYIDAIAKREEQMKPFKFTVGVWHQYDDNVILKPTDATLASGITDKGDSRQTYAFRGEYNFRPVDYFGTKAGYSLHYSKQFDLGFYDTVSNNFVLQPSFYLEDVAVSFPANYNHVIVNDKNYLSTVSIGNLNNIMFSKNQMGQASFAYKYKDFLWAPTIPAENRDSNEYMWWLAWYRFFAKNKGFFSLKYTMDFDDTKGNNWEHIGHKATGSTLLPLHEKVKLTLVGEFLLQNFLKSHTIYNQKRDDTTYLLTALLGIEIFKGAEVQLQYTFIDNGSNLNIYDYRRNVYSVGVQYKF